MMMMWELIERFSFLSQTAPRTKKTIALHIFDITDRIFEFLWRKVALPSSPAGKWALTSPTASWERSSRVTSKGRAVSEPCKGIGRLSRCFCQALMTLQETESLDEPEKAPSRSPAKTLKPLLAKWSAIWNNMTNVSDEIRWWDLGMSSK